jgi:hypothetical protein
MNGLLLKVTGRFRVKRHSHPRPELSDLPGGEPVCSDSDDRCVSDMLQPSEARSDSTATLQSGGEPASRLEQRMSSNADP